MEAAKVDSTQLSMLGKRERGRYEENNFEPEDELALLSRQLNENKPRIAKKVKKITDVREEIAKVADDLNGGANVAASKNTQEDEYEFLKRMIENNPAWRRHSAVRALLENEALLNEVARLEKEAELFKKWKDLTDKVVSQMEEHVAMFKRMNQDLFGSLGA